MTGIVIHRGNDALLRLVVRRSDGVVENYAGASDLEVLFVQRGAGWVTISPTSPIVVVDSKIEVLIPADAPVGIYRAIVKYRRGERRYLAENCRAIEVAECVDRSTVGKGESEDVMLLVQFSSDGQDGKSAYELAVQRGYLGTYEEWLKMYAGLQTMRISFMGVRGEMLHTIEVATPVEYPSYGSSYAYEPVGDWGDVVIEEDIAEEV